MDLLVKQSWQLGNDTADSEQHAINQTACFDCHRDSSGDHTDNVRLSNYLSYAHDSYAYNQVTHQVNHVG